MKPFHEITRGEAGWNVPEQNAATRPRALDQGQRPVLSPSSVDRDRVRCWRTVPMSSTFSFASATTSLAACQPTCHPPAVSPVPTLAVLTLAGRNTPLVWVAAAGTLSLATATSHASSTPVLSRASAGACMACSSSVRAAITRPERDMAS